MGTRWDKLCSRKGEPKHGCAEHQCMRSGASWVARWSRSIGWRWRRSTLLAAEASQAVDI